MNFWWEWNGNTNWDDWVWKPQETDGLAVNLDLEFVPCVKPKRWHDFWSCLSLNLTQFPAGRLKNGMFHVPSHEITLVQLQVYVTGMLVFPSWNNKKIFENIFWFCQVAFDFQCFHRNICLWILFFRTYIQTDSPASRKELMNNYFTLSKPSNTFAVYGPWELAWLCCLLVYEQQFAQQSLQPCTLYRLRGPQPSGWWCCFIPRS